ncbi:NAD-dependent epimerase/dehydratase family protein [Kitasatospora sp. NPDC101183]|uniref:NAD-dependent epimerase/dehydratase family protein n=1 Tax=Kitasatospora sp. NPDC101183 TaxID=3364100 RepID=UPI00380E1EDD
MVGHVLVTGAAGLVGGAVVRRLRVAGWGVVGVDRVPGPEVRVVADLREEEAWRRKLTGAVAVVHAAALHAPHVGAVPDGEFWEVNVEATRTLLKAAEEAGVQRFVLTSSASVYGHSLVPADGSAVWVTEETPCRPRDVYDETKLAAERLVLDAAGRMGTVCLRIARCFPEPPAVLARHRLYRGVDLADVARAHELAVRTIGASGVLNIAGPYPWREADGERLWREPAALVAERLPEVAAGFGRRGWELPAAVDRVYVSGRAADVMGYRPRYGAPELLGLSGDHSECQAGAHGT